MTVSADAAAVALGLLETEGPLGLATPRQVVLAAIKRLVDLCERDKGKQPLYSEDVAQRPSIKNKQAVRLTNK